MSSKKPASTLKSNQVPNFDVVAIGVSGIDFDHVEGGFFGGDLIEGIGFAAFVDADNVVVGGGKKQKCAIRRRRVEVSR